VKLRYRSYPTVANIKIEENIAVLELQEPVFGVAVGQFAVFYENNKVLGSGVISEALN
jgi:tRNA-specific 2-thiouridylase